MTGPDRTLLCSFEDYGTLLIHIEEEIHHPNLEYIGKKSILE